MDIIMKKKLTQELIIKHWTLSEEDKNEIKRALSNSLLVRDLAF